MKRLKINPLNGFVNVSIIQTKKIAFMVALPLTKTEYELSLNNHDDLNSKKELNLFENLSKQFDINTNDGGEEWINLM